MKYLRYFLIISITFIGFASNTSKNTKPSEGIYPGEKFPDIKLSVDKSEDTFNLTDLKGQKVLVHLWAAYDAQSHCDNVLLANTIKQNNYPVTLVSLSFDESKSVYEKTVEMDAINSNYQFWIDKQQQADLRSRYKLRNGFKSFLIDENGKIQAIDVSAQNLGLLLSKN